MSEIVKFTVYGTPVTAGSKRAFPYTDKKTGKVRAAITDASKNQRPWMQQVALTARTLYHGPLLTGPICYRMVFYFQRPNLHFGTGKNAGIIKPRFRKIKHIKKPDTMKLCRAIEDALTGVIWKDDSQCFRTFAEKVYTAEGSRCEITLFEEKEDG